MANILGVVYENAETQEPKTLQKILGDGTLAMTMDLYCHTTYDTLFSEMAKMESEVV